MLVIIWSASKRATVSLVWEVSLTLCKELQQEYWKVKDADIQALASLFLPRGKASRVDEIRYWELPSCSMQNLAASVRFKLPAESARIFLTIDWACWRLVPDKETADWTIWRGVGFWGTCLELAKDDTQTSGNLVELQARMISGGVPIAEERRKKRGRKQRERREEAMEMEWKLGNGRWRHRWVFMAVMVMIYWTE